MAGKAPHTHSHGHSEGDGEGGEPSGHRPRSHGGEGGGSVSEQEASVSARVRSGRVADAGDGGTGGGGGRPAGEGGEPVSGPQPASAGAPPQSFVDNIVGDPKSVAGKSAEDIAQEFNDAGYSATVQQSTKKGTSGKAVQVRIQGHPEITNIQVHPGGGRHTAEGEPYWKISTNTHGKTWVVPEDFRGVDELGGNVVKYDD